MCHTTNWSASLLVCIYILNWEYCSWTAVTFFQRCSLSKMGPTLFRHLEAWEGKRWKAPKEPLFLPLNFWFMAWKNWWFWTAVLEKTLESPLDSKEIKPVNPKGNNPGYSLEGLMLKLQYFRADAKSHLMWRVTWWKELTHWKRSWCWERLKAGREGDDREWDG